MMEGKENKNEETKLKVEQVSARAELPQSDEKPLALFTNTNSEGSETSKIGCTDSEKKELTRENLKEVKETILKEKENAEFL